MVERRREADERKGFSSAFICMWKDEREREKERERERGVWVEVRWNDEWLWK
jgi:hypothetical protein